MTFGAKWVFGKIQLAYFTPATVVVGGIVAAIILPPMLRAITRPGFHQCWAARMTALSASFIWHTLPLPVKFQ